MANKNLLESYTEYAGLESAFEDALDDAQTEFSELRKGYDWYDSSVEFYEVPNGLRMNEAAQRVCRESGFAIAFVNHLDGWETHYTLKDQPVQGWRVKYGSKMNPRQPTIWVERIPEGWPENPNVVVVSAD